MATEGTAAGAGGRGGHEVVRCSRGHDVYCPICLGRAGGMVRSEAKRAAVVANLAKARARFSELIKEGKRVEAVERARLERQKAIADLRAGAVQGGQSRCRDHNVNPGTGRKVRAVKAAGGWCCVFCGAPEPAEAIAHHEKIAGDLAGRNDSGKAAKVEG
jgi:hypothetical protein